MNHGTSFYTKLCTTSYTHCRYTNFRERAQANTLTQASRYVLDLPITNLEILQTLQSFKTLKALALMDSILCSTKNNGTSRREDICVLQRCL